MVLGDHSVFKCFCIEGLGGVEALLVATHFFDDLGGRELIPAGQITQVVGITVLDASFRVFE